MAIYDSRGNLMKSSKKRPSKRELGSTGRAYVQSFHNTLSTDEYLSTLMFPHDVAIYEKMARSDAQIQAVLLMLSLPIRATQWFIRPADKSSQAQEIATFVEDSLFGGFGTGLNNGYDDFIKDVTTMFQFGHSIFEKVFEVKKSKLKWKKFAVRPQSTIEEIYYDAVGDFKGIDQQIQQNTWESTYIPVEKLLVFSHDMKQGNIRGSSILRPAYKHWFIKDFLYKIVNVGVERNLVGTPVLTLPENYTQDDKDLADEIVTTLRSSEYGGVRLPEGFVLEMFEGKRTLIDVLPYIEYQDQLISRSALAQFMNLGSSSSGSFALSSDQSQLFLMMLDASAKNIANVINTHAIPELVSYNFNSNLFPTLAFKPMNSTKIVNTLKTLLDGKIIVPDDDLEAYIRDMLDLPDMNPVQSREEIAEQFKLQQRELLNQTDADKSKKQMKDGGEKSKTPIDNNSKQSTYKDKIKDDNTTKKLSEFSIDFTNISDLARNNLSAIIDKQLIALNEKAENCDINSLATIKVQYKGEMTKIVENILKDTLKLSESDIKFKGKSNIISNSISEYVKTIFLNCYINNNNVENLDKIRHTIMNNL